jgi:hypothetical protein
LQFFGAFPIHRIMQTLGIGIILKISHTEGQQMLYFKSFFFHHFLFKFKFVDLVND